MLESEGSGNYAINWSRHVAGLEHMRKEMTDCAHRIVNVMAAPSVMESPARNVIICPPDIGSEGVNVGGLEES